MNIYDTHCGGSIVSMTDTRPCESESPVMFNFYLPQQIQRRELWILIYFLVHRLIP